MTKNPETGKFAAILLAAGPSSRLGQAKQLVRLDGESLVRRAARQVLSVGPASLTVVTGYADTDIKNELRDLPVSFVRNDDWEQGMGGSIACGARKVSEQVEGILLTLCDQWRLEGNDLFRLISAWSPDISRITMASWNEGESSVYGPPALFPRKYIRELRSLKGPKGASGLIGENLEKVKFVEMENAAYDLDRPEDLKQFLK